MSFTGLKPTGEDTRLLVTGGAGHSYNIIGSTLLFFIFISITTFSWSQRNADLGIFSGVSYYTGEINPDLHFYNPSAAFGGVARYNFNPRNSLRFNGFYGSLKGDDLDFKNDFQQFRAVNFKCSILDLAVTTEFNFMPFTAARRKDKYSPYVAGGLGYNILFKPKSNNPLFKPSKGTTGLVFIFGGGLKLNLTGKISTGLEWSFRKTFNDRLDGIENQGPEYNTFYHNTDWYYIAGVFVTYKFLNYLNNCPAYDDD